MMRGVLRTGAAGGLTAALLLAWPTMAALERLAVARDDRAAAAVAPPPPAPLVQPEQAWPVGETDPAVTIGAALRARARAAGVLVERAEPLAAPEGLATLAVRLSGSERAVLALADGLERGMPMARWRRWRVTAEGEGVRIDGELVAPWR